MKRRCAVPALMSAAVLVASSGCQTTSPRIPLDPISMAAAVGLVNDNISRITVTLRASGPVDGHFTLPSGRTRSYHVNGTLFYLAPSYVRFDLKALGSRQFLFGSNADAYWVYNGQEDTYHCGLHGQASEWTGQLPVRPDQLIDALGLSPIPMGSAGRGTLHRVEAEVQQVLFLEFDQAGNPTLEKEYWLDRHPPRLVRRVIFRDADGRVMMESILDDYRPLEPDGPLLPHRMTVSWPLAGAEMRFQVRGWRRTPTVHADGIQFALPRPCAGDPLP